MSEKFIRKADRAAVYYLPDARRAALVAEAKRARLKTIAVDIAPDTKTGKLLERLGDILDFPDWYGANFDALHDCLGDPECLPAKRLVLLLTGSSHLQKSDPDGLSTLIGVFAAVSSELRQQDRALWVLLDSRADGVGELPQA